jgi:integrase
LPGLHPHELWHTATSLAIAGGADVKAVQQMLGHKSSTMTLDLYGHLFPDRLDEVAEQLGTTKGARTGLGWGSAPGGPAGGSRGSSPRDK